jgi:hypothetical protein
LRVSSKIAIGKRSLFARRSESGVNAGHERCVLKTPNDPAIFLVGEMTQVILRFKVIEWLYG